MSVSSPVPVSSAMPLPPDVVVHASWFGRARQFPIFSMAWFRYRSIAFLTGLLAAALLNAALAAIPLQPQNVDWVDVLRIGFVFGVPCVVLVLLGPGLAVWVRARGWPVRREFAGLLCMLLLGMAASLATAFQLKHWYEAARVDPATGGRVVHLLPRVQFTVNWQAGPRFSVEPGTSWRKMSPEELKAFDVLQSAQAALARVAPAGEVPLTPQESAAVEAYLKLKSANTSLTPAQEQATQAGRAAFEKLLRYQVEQGTRPQPARAAPASPAYVAAQAKYDEALAEFQRVQARHAPATAMPAAAPRPGGHSTAGTAGAVVMLLAVVLLVCWLGGITDLVAFVRQRGKLDDVLRDQALRRADAARVEAELRLSVLAAQVEPHFLFNTLASVRSAIVSDQARAAAIVDHLADYLRATIPQMRHEAASGSVPLARQLDAARAYLALMHERMPRLAFAVEAEPGLEAAQVPPLMLISLVENAVKHGVEPKAGPARITVTARRVVDAGVALLELEVRDDGVGFGSATSGTGVGLANIQERLAGLYGGTAGMTLKALPEGGVAAILRLPLTA
ncbi:histidine kinase [Telluria mixta]|uniref:Histidine kinase n=1 Tax=Telluria mixta TaxID=34071 RepID=A0ABT2C079_9BURK|nr:histidine kinase [Telluria mixta]MCS0630789.1 histidine kinase [Telluria mixta]WEM98791.1 histidine kinase [Telluria mixta]